MVGGFCKISLWGCPEIGYSPPKWSLQKMETVMAIVWILDHRFRQNQVFSNSQIFLGQEFGWVHMPILLDELYTGWWFGTFFIVPYIGNNHPNWLIFFKGVETTNQYIMYCILYVRYHQDVPIPNASCIEHVRRGLHDWYIYIYYIYIYYTRCVAYRESFPPFGGFGTWANYAPHWWYSISMPIDCISPEHF